ncbi:hypothetical protein LB572_21360 [Mesorhizobium sp. BH1-1-5]|uniref:hypothetical protein n=1 Tax=Mesorhizobium sp. BH1-1-5 TaxID=2876661 RepID=UPI001CCCA56C|nr:hypothetical protein [Mesorhizobium sp. BH1-1-5]MBZ9989649.1 hypothetical protein [Mesorhizobium sp. BH1-1-5]
MIIGALPAGDLAKDCQQIVQRRSLNGAQIGLDGLDAGTKRCEQFRGFLHFNLPKRHHVACSMPPAFFGSFSLLSNLISQLYPVLRIAHTPVNTGDFHPLRDFERFAGSSGVLQSTCPPS